VISYIRHDTLAYVEDIAEGLKSAPAVLIGLFHGRNVDERHHE
jgi:2-alkenal reductase